MSKIEGRPPSWSRAAARIGTPVLVAGVVLLLAAGALQLYTLYAQLHWEREQQALSAQFLSVPTQVVQAAAQPTQTATQAPSATPVQTPTVGAPLAPGSADAATATPRPTETPTLVPARTLTPAPPIPGDPGQLIVPRLKLTAQIVTVPMTNGQWDVSKIIYDVGLLAGTGFPGQPGNAAISGHVSLKGRGDGPFRWLEKLVPDDEIIVQQEGVRYTYRVIRSSAVLPDDVSVLAPTDTPTLTLITCTDWDFLKAEYVRRLIVTATLANQRKIVSPGQ